MNDRLCHKWISSQAKFNEDWISSLMDDRIFGLGYLNYMMTGFGRLCLSNIPEFDDNGQTAVELCQWQFNFPRQNILFPEHRGYDAESGNMQMSAQT